MTREPVEATPRKAMTVSRKLAVWKAWEGRCGMCGKPVPIRGSGVVYDHMIPLMIGGADDTGNLQPLHADPCNKEKTALDAKHIAKLRRLLRGRKVSIRPIRSRGFDKTLTRGFDGTIRRRTA